MDILFVVPGGQDLGGIITSTEQYVAGLKEIGHHVTFMTVSFTKNPPPTSVPRGQYANDFIPGPGTGELYHTTQGWRGEHRLSLLHPNDRKQFIELGKMHDVIIWASMYGFRNPATEGRSDWAEIFPKLRGKHVFMIHDDHISDRYPWAFALAKYARAFVGVQPCSYDSLADVAAPRAMVYTPLPPMPRKVRPLEERSGFLSCQVWKGWKHGDKMVAAAAHMSKGSVSFAGDGIQLRYLRSKDKCPPRWEGLWDAAMKRQGKFSYHGVLNEQDRDEMLSRAKFLVDLSLRHNSGQYNRIVQEAMSQGCVVIANPRFISGDKGSIFIPNVHYVAIDSILYDNPKNLAARLEGIERDVWAGRYAKIQKQARVLMGLFDRTTIAERLVKAITAESFLDGVVTPEMKRSVKAGEREFIQVFGGKP